MYADLVARVGEDGVEQRVRERVVLDPRQECGARNSGVPPNLRNRESQHTANKFEGAERTFAAGCAKPAIAASAARLESSTDPVASADVAPVNDAMMRKALVKVCGTRCVSRRAASGAGSTRLFDRCVTLEDV